MLDKFTLVEGEQSRQGSEAWLKFREGKVGASDAPSIMGISPWETKLECWERFVLGTRKEKTPAMERGHKYEERARQLYCDRVKDSFVPVVAQSVECPQIIASLDGWNGKKILEIKCPNKESHLMARQGEIPLHYICQMQHQMFVMGCEEADYCSYDYLSDTIAVITLKRDEEMIQSLKSTEMAFISSVVDLQPPEATDKDWKEIDDPILVKEALRYKEINLYIKALEKEKENVRNVLISKAIHPRMKLGTVKMQKTISDRRVDYKKIIEDYKIANLKPYYKPSSESWRIE